MEEDGEYLFHSQKASSATSVAVLFHVIFSTSSFNMLRVRCQVDGEIVCLLKRMVVGKKMFLGLIIKL
jgi:hypothetical protein